MKGAPAAGRPDTFVRFWGVRGSLPSPRPETDRHGGNTSCVEVRSGGEILICDAGSGIRTLGRELMREREGASISANLLISHTHWDHVQGLPFFLPAYSPDNAIRVIGAAGHRAKLEAGLQSQMQPLHFPVPFSLLRGLRPVEQMKSTSARLGPFSVRSTELNHPGGCAGFRIEVDDATVCYLPDHEPYRAGSSHASRHRPNVSGDEAQDELIEFVRECDLLILDTQYDEPEYAQRVGWGHGCVTDSVELAIAAGVRQLSLFHHDPDHGDEKLQELVTQARRQAAAAGASLMIDAAREHQELALPLRRRLAA